MEYVQQTILDYTNLNFDLRSFAGQMYDQGDQGTCLPNAVAAAINMIEIEQGKPAFNGARDQLYYDAQQASGLPHSLTGGTIPAGITQVLMNKGFATESLYNYTDAHATVPPTTDVENDASLHKITDFYTAPDYNRAATMSRPVIVSWVDHFLDEGKPIIIGFTVKSWYSAEHGDINTLNPANAAGNAGGDFGGHAGLIVGSEQSLCGGRGGFIVQNSWGTGYGDHGFMVIPWDEFPGATPNPSTNAYNIISLDVITGFNGVDQTYSAESSKVAQLYAIELRRLPEAAGEKFYTGLIQTGTFSADTIAQAMWNSPEAQAIHKGETNGQIVDDMYHFILGRDADAAGKAFYVAKLDAGMNAGVLYSDVANYVDNLQSGGDMTAHNYLQNEEDVGQYYGIAMQVDGTHLDLARSTLNLVTSDANQCQLVKTGISTHLPAEWNAHN